MRIGVCSSKTQAPKVTILASGSGILGTVWWAWWISTKNAARPRSESSSGSRPEEAPAQAGPAPAGAPWAPPHARMSINTLSCSNKVSGGVLSIDLRRQYSRHGGGVLEFAHRRECIQHACVPFPSARGV